MSVTLSIFWMCLSYVMGSIPSGYVIVKAFIRKDPRQHGSGNIGATNVMRIAGKRLSALTYLFDVIKIWIPLGLFSFMGMPSDVDYEYLISFLIIMGCFGVMGHMYSCFLRLDGGKGVASFTGLCLWLFPYSAVIGLSIFFVLAFATRIVSIASLVAISVSSIYIFLYEIPAGDEHIILWAKFIFIFMVLLIFWRHKSNILRLIKGTENKIKL